MHACVHYIPTCSDNASSLLLWLYANLQSTMATYSLPSVLPSLLYTATVVCLPSLYYNSLYVAWSVLPS